MLFILCKLIDIEDSGFLNIRQLTLGLGIVKSTRVPEKLALLYILHLPALLSQQEIELIERPPKPHSDGAEEAAEAENYFGYKIGKYSYIFDIFSNIYFDSNDDIWESSLPASESLTFDALGDASNADSSQHSGDSGSDPLNIRGGCRADASSLANLRVILDQPESYSKLNLPTMSLAHFSALWTSLLEIINQNDVNVRHACKYRVPFYLFFFPHLVYIFQTTFSFNLATVDPNRNTTISRRTTCLHHLVCPLAPK